jgi:Ca2+/H+ antiporter, TMEM165/GDT1 family
VWRTRPSAVECLGTRHRPLFVWTGAAAAFAVQMAMAVTAGQLLALLPRDLVDGIVAAVPGRGRVLVDIELPRAAPGGG